MNESLIVVGVLAVIVIVLLIKTAVVVPQRLEYIVERLGKYSKSLSAGFHILIPFLDKVAYKRTLKEEVMDIPSQDCITTDNVSVSVDGILYLQVMDSKLSCYGIDDYRVAASQLAQTSLRSVVGKIELDRTFEERESLNQQVVAAIDEAEPRSCECPPPSTACRALAGSSSVATSERRSPPSGCRVRPRAKCCHRYCHCLSASRGTH